MIHKGLLDPKSKIRGSDDPDHAPVSKKAKSNLKEHKCVSNFAAL